MTKMLLASGGLYPPDQGLCPWTPLGALPPDSRYRLVLRTRHGAPPQPLTPSAAYDDADSAPHQTDHQTIDMTVLLGLIVVEPVDCQRCMSAVLWPRENKTETSDCLRVLKGPIELSVPMSTFWHKIRVGLLYFVRIHSCAFGTQLTGLLDVSICLFLCHN